MSRADGTEISRGEESKKKRGEDSRTTGTQEAIQRTITDEGEIKWNTKDKGTEEKGEEKRGGETCDPLGSHHTEAFSIQELGVQLSLQGSDHTVTDTNTYTRTHALHTSTHYLSRSHTHTHMRTCFGLCFELIPATGESWLIIILSYGLHMVIWFYCYEEI